MCHTSGIHGTPKIMDEIAQVGRLRIGGESMVGGEKFNPIRGGIL